MKLIPQIDTYPKLIAFSQTTKGKATLLTVFAAGLFINRVHFWIEISVALAMITYLPSRRRLILSLVSVYWILRHSVNDHWTFVSAIAVSEGQSADWTLRIILLMILGVVLGTLALYFNYVRKRSASYAAKRPVFFMLSSFFTLLSIAGCLPLTGVSRFLIWAVIAVTAPYLWYFAYCLKDATSKSCDDAFSQVGTLRPFWGGTNVPFLKGAANLRKIEAKNAIDISIAQLKAIKLLMWATILGALQILIVIFVHGDTPLKFGDVIAQAYQINVPAMGIPRLGTAILSSDVSFYVSWMSLISHFVVALLAMASGPNLVIACGRMAGFNALRNSYKPLEAISIADFWNRYYYYFKELLVEFFFFPVFTRYFKENGRVRLFVATMSAATVGNIIYHFFRDYHYVAELGLWQAIVGFRVYAFYALVLGLGIAISQIRNSGKERSLMVTTRPRRLAKTAGVLMFFCLLEIFDRVGPDYSFELCGRFFLRLFLLPL